MGQSTSGNIMCLHPTGQHPYYHLSVPLSVERGSQFMVKGITVNGNPTLDFSVYHKNQFRKERTAYGSGKNNVIARCDWKNGEEITLDIVGEEGGQKEKRSIRKTFTAPARGGYWDSRWPFYTSVVCTETAGISREHEPVHVTLAFYSDRVKDPERELRIVRIDQETGETEEIPSQVYAVEHYHHDAPDERYQPTIICEVAFLADVPAYSSQVFLAFYGSEKATRPVYDESLTTRGKGLGLSLENKFYKIKLAATSGAIDEITLKGGDSPCTFAHHLETNGALHWNPGIYAPPRPWLHASDWNPPAHHSVVQGPVFTMTRRSGTLDHYPEAEVSITYLFYGSVPWVVMSSSIEIKKNIAVKALRNGEIVLNRELVDEFAWREPDGSGGTMLIQDGPRHPRHAKVLPYNTPWACFFNRDNKCGLGMLTVDVNNFRNDGGIGRTFRPYSYLQWGPWAYYARPLVYTFVSSGPGRLIPVPAGNVYYEKMAFVPFAYEDDKTSFQYLDQLYGKLEDPLSVTIVEDTDTRAPRNWMAPILVEEFEEMEA